MTKEDLENMRLQIADIHIMLLGDGKKQLGYNLRIDRLEQSEKFKMKLIFACTTWLICLSAAVIKGIL